MTPTLGTTLPSVYRDGYEHVVGTPLVLVEALDPERRVWVVELRVPDPTLEGGAWYEFLELDLSQIDFAAECREDMEVVRRAAVATAPSRSYGVDVRTPQGENVFPRVSTEAA